MPSQGDKKVTLVVGNSPGRTRSSAVLETKVSNCFPVARMKVITILHGRDTGLFITLGFNVFPREVTMPYLIQALEPLPEALGVSSSLNPEDDQKSLQCVICC